MKFSATPIKCIYDTEGFKVYACNVDIIQYPNIKVNNYGNVTICGSIPSLILDSEYNIDATEDKGKYGISYKINFISIKKETSGEGLRQFLLGCGLSSAQSDEICREYPNIVSLVRDGKTNEIDTDKLHNIGKVRIAVIIRKIEENFMLASVAEELGGYFDYSIIKKLYDKYHSVDEIVDKIKEEPYKCLCSISGVGFKTADTKLLKLEHKIKENLKLGKEVPFEFENDLITSKDRCISAMIYLLDENETLGNTIMKLVDIKKALDKLVPECKHHFMDICKEDNQSEKPRFHIDKEHKWIAKATTNFQEQSIAKTLINAIHNPTKWDIDIEQYRVNDNITLTDEQLNTLKMVCENNFCVLCGYSGSGKSSSVTALIKMLKTNNKSFMVLTPTGKSAKVISNYTKERASTIHKLLFSLQETDNKLTTDIVIVDEISMCDLSLFYSLLSIIDLSITKLLLIGDNAQLASVSCGNVLHDIINSNTACINSLTKIFRYGENSLLTVATDIRNGKSYLDKPLTDNSYMFINTPQEKMLLKLKRLYTMLLSKGYDKSDILILSSYNKGNYGTVAINNLLQPIANSNINNPKMCKEVKCDNNIITYAVGDMVIQTKNNYNSILCDDKLCVIYNENGDMKKIFVPNGETGIIKDIQNGNFYIQFEDGIVVYNMSDMLTIKLAYSISIHKSQGSQSKVVIVVTPKAHTFFLTSNLLYVAVTRGCSKVFHFSDAHTINMAIKKKDEIKRNTWLKQYLMEFNGGNNNG